MFLQWLHHSFILETIKYLEEKGLHCKVFLIVENAPRHLQFIMATNENVEVIFPLPNTTLLLQPLDQASVKCSKTTYICLTFCKLWDGS